MKLQRQKAMGSCGTRKSNVIAKRWSNSSVVSYIRNTLTCKAFVLFSHKTALKLRLNILNLISLVFFFFLFFKKNI